MARAPLFARGALAVLLLVLACAGVLGVARAQDAQRRAPNGWALCNETSYVLEAATAKPDGRAVLVQGWVRLRPGECRLAVQGPLVRGTHYLYARTSAAHRGGRRQWGGDAALCVDPGHSFTIENPPQCSAMGLEERRFRRVAINRRESWSTIFSEADNYSPARAQAAGLQRLLSDAGYDSTSDARSGVDPRAISASIARFRADARLAPNTNTDGLIDALETAARRRSDQIGLTLCNRTNARIWTSVARRRGEGWESRGWWPLGPGGCARTIDEPLLQTAYFIDATMDSNEGDRLLAAGGEPFCTSPARFAILGREHCEDRYYDTAYFSRISSSGRPGLVVEFFERDFLPAGERPAASRLAVAHEGDVAPVESGVRRGVAPANAPRARSDQGGVDPSISDLGGE